MFSAEDTIVALATPPGRGGIAVVRLSGPDARSIALTLTGRSTLEARRATHAQVSHPQTGQVIDDAVLTWFQAPQSYTGDDVVELGLHGSPPVVREILESACRLGARLAGPGEFTFRAYLNRRLDLVQAEAVADLIDALTPAQARLAVDQLEGTLSSRIRGIDAALFDVVARLEASLDFPDEGFHFITPAEARDDLTRVQASLAALVSDGRRGGLIREGRLVVIAGRPNVGKSSLFNALVGVSRAIVTPTAGTTRDVLTEIVDIEGVPVTLVDTAGLREAKDAIEAEGVRRAREAIQASALSVVVLDGSSPLTDEDRALMAEVPHPRLLVVNKVDQPFVWDRASLAEATLVVSAVTGEGLEGLRASLADVLGQREERRDLPMISNARHVRCAEQAVESVSSALALLRDGATEEVVLAELAQARRALESLTGVRTSDDLLSHVFSRFCVGK